jgi:hypothetical protein
MEIRKIKRAGGFGAHVANLGGAVLKTFRFHTIGAAACWALRASGDRRVLHVFSEGPPVSGCVGAAAHL